MTDSFLDDLGRQLDAADRALRATPAPRGEPARRRHAGSERSRAATLMTWRRAALVVAVVGAVATVVALTGGAGGTDLSARAYAATTGPGIVHWRTEIVGSYGGKVGSRQRTEGWARNGVTHELRFDVVHGTGVLQSDSRTAGGRVTTWVRAEHDYLRFPAGKQSGTDPFRSGDPFAIFRRAYRAGKLTKVGPSRFGIDLPGRSDDAHRNDPLTYYDIDPDTALPIRFVVKTPASRAVPGHPEAERLASETVMTFAVYEKLPFDATTRKLLRLLPHRSGGPRTIAAAEHFAVLRSGAVPSGEDATAVAKLAHSSRFRGLDTDAARAVAPRMYLVPGREHVCLVTVSARGSGYGCKATEEVLKRGIDELQPGRALLLVVPDGVTAVRARMRGRRSARVVVHDNFVRLPATTYDWRFLR